MLKVFLFIIFQMLKILDLDVVFNCPDWLFMRCFIRSYADKGWEVGICDIQS